MNNEIITIHPDIDSAVMKIEPLLTILTFIALFYVLSIII